jgi:hypothetical protein
LLAIGGYLILETGNYQSAERISNGSDWWAYQADHRWYHAPDILRAIMESAGLGNIVYADSVFRLWWRGKPGFDGPSKIAHIKSGIRRPNKALKEWRKYKALRQCAKEWPNWSGLSIFTIAGQNARQIARSR